VWVWIYRAFAKPPSLHFFTQKILQLFDIYRFSAAASPEEIKQALSLCQTKMDCSRLYKDFWEKIDRE